MAARDNLGRVEASPYTSAPFMLFVGETAVIRRFRLSSGKLYRVLLIDGCGSLTIRAYDPADASRFADVTYRSLAAFMCEWEVV